MEEKAANLRRYIRTVMEVSGEVEHVVMLQGVGVGFQGVGFGILIMVR
jgi:hypothetical protein